MHQNKPILAWASARYDAGELKTLPTPPSRFGCGGGTLSSFHSMPLASRSAEDQLALCLCIFSKILKIAQDVIIIKHTVSVLTQQFTANFLLDTTANFRDLLRRNVSSLLSSLHLAV